jgi:hypothetical protein
MEFQKEKQQTCNCGPFAVEMALPFTRSLMLGAYVSEAERTHIWTPALISQPSTETECDERTIEGECRLSLRHG